MGGQYYFFFFFPESKLRSTHGQDQGVGMGFVDLLLTGSLFGGLLVWESGMCGDKQGVGIEVGCFPSKDWWHPPWVAGGGGCDWDPLWFVGHGECGPGVAYVVRGM